MILLVAIGIVGGIITGNGNVFNKSAKPIKVITEDQSMKIDSYSIKINDFNSLKELENSTPIIVKGIKTSEVDKLFDGPETMNSGQRGGYTESSFTIEKVYKNKNDIGYIKKNEVITIQESEYSKNNQSYTINGYQKMKIGELYLLYLVENKGFFAPVETVYGKIPLAVDDLELYSEKQLNIVNTENIQSINDLEEDLKPLFKEARNKYRD